MIIRRFVNLVVENYATGGRSLHRLDVAKHLFYPSTALAEAASAKNKEKQESNNGGGDIKPPRRIGSSLLRQLPPPTMCLKRFPATDDDDDDHGFPPEETFALLGGGADGSRILHAGKGGEVLLYDADAGSTAALPDLAFAQPEGLRQPLFISLADDAGAGAGKHKESLYVITDRHGWNYNRHSFEVLDLSQLPRSRWEHLPPPPFITSTTPTCPGVKSFAVVDGGRTSICASMSSVRIKGTYCFDTRSREWWHASDWKLPFHGRAEYVPELHSWFGSCCARGWWHAGDYRLPFHGRRDEYDEPQLLSWPGCGRSCFDDLCSSSSSHVLKFPPNIAGISEMPPFSCGGGAGAPVLPAPKLQHVWQDVNPPKVVEQIELKGRLRCRIKQWLLRGRDLINQV